jgi:signal transduction histidine kinase
VTVGAFHVSSRTPNFYDDHDVRVAAAFGERVAVALRNARRYAAEQERARAAEELANLRSDFVAAVSHELRTPLTAIIGYSELIRARWAQLEDAHRLQQLERIVVAANRQQRLVEDLLIVSRLDLDIAEVQCVPILIAPLVRRAMLEVQGSYLGQRIDLEGSELLQAHAEPERTLQIITNLIDNAAKYSAEGSEIAVHWEADADTAMVRVRDRGPGVPDQGRAHLFTRFGRVPGSRARSGHVGTGLGLYLGQRFARSMGGDLDLETTGPEGSIFRLRLPMPGA